MSKKRTVFKNSTIVRVVLVVIILVLPVNILTLVLSGVVLRSNREQDYQGVQNSLDQAMINMEDQLQASYRRMALLNADNTDFRILEYYSDEDEQIESTTSYAAATKELRNVCSESTIVNAAYFYLQGPDRMMVQGNVGLASTAVNDYLLSISESDSSSAIRWETIDLGGQPLLISHTVWNNADYGVIVNLDFAFSALSFGNEEGRTLFFCDQEENVFSAAGDSLFEEGMTLSEMRASGRYQVIESSLEDYDLKLVEVIEINRAMNSIPVVLRILESLAIAATALVIPLLLWYIHRRITVPLHRLTTAMDHIESGDIDYRIEQVEDGGREFEQINRNFNSMMEQVRDLKIDAYETELARKDIYMQYLSRQIQPHFILNALNIMYSYEADEYPLIQKMILCLSKYFRYIVRVNTRFVDLQHEMEHIRNYFEIQKIRYMDSFSYEVEYDEDLSDVMIPVLLVQNFAENTVKYSMKSGKGVLVRVTAQHWNSESGEEQVIIRVTDTGGGISDEVLEEIRRFKDTGEPQKNLGVGITNAIERLKYFYGERETDIRFYRDEDTGGTVVEIILPAVFEKEGNDNNESTFGRR